MHEIGKMLMPQSWNTNNKTMFTLEALMLGSDIYVAVYTFKCGQYQTPVWTGHGPDVTRMHRRTRRHTQHAVYGSKQEEDVGNLHRSVIVPWNQANGGADDE